MKDIWKKNGIFILIAAYLFLISAVFYFPGKFLVGKIKSTADTIQEKILDREIDKRRVEKLPEMEKNWQEIEARKESLDVILSSDAELGFIQSVERIAEKTGNVIALEIGENADPKEIAKLKKNASKKEGEKGIMEEITYASFFPIRINIKGDYLAFGSFVKMLENSQYYVNIISLDVKKVDISEEKKDQSRNPFASKEEQVAPEKKEILNASINALVYTKN